LDAPRPKNATKNSVQKSVQKTKNPKKNEKFEFPIFLVLQIKKKYKNLKKFSFFVLKQKKN
jgi:hypothetical protein